MNKILKIIFLSLALLLSLGVTMLIFFHGIG